jgi:hypothetical protein
MKTMLNLAMALCVFGIFLTTGANCLAQTQTVTLAVNSGSLQPPPTSYTVTTNQIVKIISLASGIIPGTVVASSNPPSVSLYHSSGVKITPAISIGTYTGLTNISVNAVSAFVTGNEVWCSGLVTIEIETPATANVISNYIPADAIVIPARATGNVQIILEASPDLVNWTAASPGTYGASAGTNRFFRVRASITPWKSLKIEFLPLVTRTGDWLGTRPMLS